MATDPRQVRGNVYIRLADNGCAISDGGVTKTYGNRYEASDEHPLFLDAYRCLLAGVSILGRRRLQSPQAVPLTQTCWALGGQFRYKGRPAQLAIFTKPGSGTADETLAVQVTCTVKGRLVDLYSTLGRHCDEFNRFVQSAEIYFTA